MPSKLVSSSPRTGYFIGEYNGGEELRTRALRHLEQKEYEYDDYQGFGDQEP
jgi:hypothetical protein